MQSEHSIRTSGFQKDGNAMDDASHKVSKMGSPQLDRRNKGQKDRDIKKFREKFIKSRA